MPATAKTTETPPHDEETDELLGDLDVLQNDFKDFVRAAPCRGTA